MHYCKTHTFGSNLFFFCLFGLILYVPVKSFSVMSGWVFLGLTSTKQREKCLAQGHNAASPDITEPPRSLSILF